MISGLISTSLSLGSLPMLRSITVNRFDTPTCGAARPIPCEAYVVSNMSATSSRKSALNSVTGSPGCESTGSGYLTILRIIAAFYLLHSCLVLILVVPYLFDVATEIPLHFEHRVATEFLLRQACDCERYHGFGGHARGRNYTNIAAFVAGARSLAGVKAN